MNLFDCNLSHFEMCPLLPPLNINKGTFFATETRNKLLGLKQRPHVVHTTAKHVISRHWEDENGYEMFFVRVNNEWLTLETSASLSPRSNFRIWLASWSLNFIFGNFTLSFASLGQSASVLIQPIISLMFGIAVAVEFQLKIFWKYISKGRRHEYLPSTYCM